LAISFAISVTIAAVALYALIDNNNQGEAYDAITGAVDWTYLTEIAVIWFIVVFFVMSCLLFLVRGVVDGFRR
jgi:hypothetical protein